MISLYIVEVNWMTIEAILLYWLHDLEEKMKTKKN